MICHKKGYSLDQIKMTEWIWPNHDNHKPYQLNMIKIETNNLLKPTNLFFVPSSEETSFLTTFYGLYLK